MANYIIIGGDNKEYGPVTEADVRQWISEGRLNGQSRVKAESDAEFRALAQFPEFANALGSQMAPATITPVPTADDFLNRDYELDIGGCFSEGMEVFKNNMSVLFVGGLIYIGIQIAASVFGKIPLIGPFFSLANFICSGPLMGGVFYLFLQVIRNQPAQAGDVFQGFKRGFGQLFLAVLVVGLLIGLCMLPFIIVFLVKLIPMLGQLQQLQHLQPGTAPDPETIKSLKSLVFTSLPVAFICAIPATYLATSWKFTLPLIVDRQMDFAAAMRASWRMVNKHWWTVFGLMVLIGLVNIAGLLACCIGGFFSMPFGFVVLMLAYEKIFGTRKN